VIDRVVKVGGNVILAAYTVYCGYEVARVEQQYRRGEITPEQRSAALYRRGVGYGLSVAGGWSGGVVGVAVGAAFGPTGMFIGGVVGGLVGAIAGERAGFRLAGPTREAVNALLNAVHQLAARVGAGLHHLQAFLSDRAHLQTTRWLFGQVKEKAKSIYPPRGERLHLFRR
jgi:hypothetical protein